MNGLLRCFGLSGVLSLAFIGSALAGAGGPCATGTVHSLPEPASIALLAAGVAGIVAVRRRSRRK